jgi:hypothetical protein
MPDDLDTLRDELRLLRAHAAAQDLIIAAIAAHLQAVTLPGFLAAAFDSAAATASRMNCRGPEDIRPQTWAHIERMRSAFDAATQTSRHSTN